MIFLKLFAALLIGHALCDYPLQGDFLARGKNRFNPIPGVPWFWCLSAHAAIHAGMVWAVTGHFYFALTELVFHFAIDDTKCSLMHGPGSGAMKPSDNYAAKLFNLDQLAHVVCKAAWVLLLWWGTR